MASSIINSVDAVFDDNHGISMIRLCEETCACMCTYSLAKYWEGGGGGAGLS